MSRAETRAAVNDIDAFLAGPPPDRQATAAAVLDPNHHPRRVAPFIPDHEIAADPELALRNDAAVTVFGMEVRETFAALDNLEYHATGGDAAADTADTSTTAGLPSPPTPVAAAGAAARAPNNDGNNRRSSPRRSRLPERFRNLDIHDNPPAANDDTNPEAEFLLDNGSPVDAEEIADEETAAATATAGDHAFKLPSVSLQEMEAGIISINTRNGYATYMKQFFLYCRDNQPDWLTPHCLAASYHLDSTESGERPNARNKRIKALMDSLLDNIGTHPLLNLQLVTPTGFMGHIRLLRKKKQDGTEAYLSSNSYYGHRSALFHLFRCHNKVGFEPMFNTELGNLFTGFIRTIVKRKTAKEAASEGKDAMPVALYMQLCHWFLEDDSKEGLFCYCYLVLSWNLMCRTNNTATIRLADIEWSSFDSFSIAFSHTKNQQLGHASKHKRNLYANPKHPIVCPVFAMSLYCSICMSTGNRPDSFLFGQDASTFSKGLDRMLRKMEAEGRLARFGKCKGDIGTHSIRKGAITYLSSLPGGPPSASICIRAGWTMGRVKDTYMKFAEAGDQFCGRALCMANILTTDFAQSPPLWRPSAQSSLLNQEGLDELCFVQFKGFHGLDGTALMQRMLLASHLFHRDWLLQFLDNPNSFIMTSSSVYRNDAVVAYVQQEQAITVTHPWLSPELHFSGVPPHVAQMNSIMAVKEAQSNLMEQFVGKLGALLDERGVGGGPMAEVNLKKIIGQELKGIREKIDNIGLKHGLAIEGEEENQQPNASIVRQPLTNQTFRLHVHGVDHDGQARLVPQGWQFPKSPVHTMWDHWWVGDTIRSIPPLSSMKPTNLASNEERRKMTKVYSYCNRLMDWLCEKVWQSGRWPISITQRSVTEMWNDVLASYVNEHCGVHSSQLSWYTIADKLVKRKELPSSAAIKAFKRRRMERETPKDTETISNYLNERDEAIMERAAEQAAFAVATDLVAAAVTQDDDGDGDAAVAAVAGGDSMDESLDGEPTMRMAL